MIRSLLCISGLYCATSCNVSCPALCVVGPVVIHLRRFHQTFIQKTSVHQNFHTPTLPTCFLVILAPFFRSQTES
ncbi:hypothetical protein BGW36DRAFT_386098 [Talaromyces proteolyticus]|uniref:Secreted protein n=1 Tax=Talaromyces proteolyticus TaxID=1131652 RepID=A0AAD4KK21_9EURO|nr:uncharacterized protein BGW36DRAFT_386098 [Talaromyces proteolyticus]KAH8693185.1 hypothetical protein BGW36DRAFT_386098 [Talaromyces proteolyticus]